MATISNNEIKIKYSLDTTDLANATALFDRLSAEDRQLLNDLKRLQAQLNATGQAGQTAGRNIGAGNKAAAGSLTDLQNRVRDLTNRLNNLNPTASNYETILKRLQRAQANLNIATAQMNEKLGKTQTQFQALNSSMGDLGRTILAVFSIQQLLSFSKSVLDTTIKMEGLRKAIEFTAESAIGGAADFRFLEKIAQDLGLPLASAAEGFKTFSAAAQRAGIAVMQQRQMFTDLSKGMAALQVDAQSAGLIFFGFSQLMSKAKVSAQELYHQIGERLPIAMEAAQIAAARLTGQNKVTTSQLIDMVEKGKLISTEFAPEFTKAIGELSKSGAYVETLGKNVNRLSNSWERFKAALGDSTFLGGLVSGLKSVVDYLEKTTEAANYYAENGLFPEISFRQFKEFEKEAIDTYDKVSSTANFRFRELTDINSQFQKEVNKDTEEGELYRFVLQAQYNEKRKKVVQDLVDNIKREEANIKKAQDEIAKTSFGIGPSTNKDRVIQLKQDIKIAEAAKAAFEKMYGDIPEFATFLPDPEKEKKKQKELENLYKKLIAQQEALMKAEEDLIKSRTKAGSNQDILILENRVKFNNEMLALDQDARFKELELAKNNAVKRKAELQKDAEEEQEIVRQARFKAFAAETEYLEKTLEFIRDNAKKRRQQLQTDEQNELEDSKALVNEKIKVLTEEYDKAKKIEAQSKDSLELLEMNYQDALTKLTEEGNRDREAIREKYRAKEKADLMKAEVDVRSTVVEAATIRNVALAKSESEKASIAEEGAITQLNIKKEENTKLAQLQLEQGGLTEAQQKIINNKLEADNLLLDAQITQIVQQGEERRRKEREEKANKALEIGQTVADGLFDIYNQQLNNEITALNNKYNEEVRLADGNKQKLAELEQKKNEKEKELKIKQFRADQMAAAARVIFATATQLMSSALNPALIPYIIGLSVAQLAAIAAQPVPEFAEGTKGRPFKGGPAIVGERGVEKVVTQSGKVYYTPPTATLIDLPKGSQVIPNHALNKKELFMANALNQGRPIGSDSAIVPKLDEIGGILKSLPVHQVNMNEKGFEKFIRTPRRTTKILNSQFPSKF